MNMPIFYIEINKGIVGKNKLAFTLIGYLPDNGKQALLLESDTSNLDVYNKESHSLVQSRLAESPPRKQYIHTCWHGEPRHLFHCCLMEVSCCGSASGSAQGRCSRPPCYGCLRNHSGCNLPLLRNSFRDIRRKKVLRSKSGPT